MMPPDISASSDEPLDRLVKAASQQGRREEEEGGGGLVSGGGASHNGCDSPGPEIAENSRGMSDSGSNKGGAGAAAHRGGGGQSASLSGDEDSSKGGDAGSAAELHAAAAASAGQDGFSTSISAGPNRRAIVHAPYHDNSASPPTPAENEQLGSLHNPAAPSPLARSQHAKEPTFPLKLHMILARAEWQDIICWLPHGRSFRILNPNAFEDVVLPLYFQHGRYASFARQLNGWNFRRISRGTDFNSYYHELFLRGLPHLCLRMKRLTAKDMAEQKKEIAKQHQQLQSREGGSTGTGQSRREGDPPDFYSLSRSHPLPAPNDGGASSNNSGGGGSPLPGPLSAFLQGAGGGAPGAAPPAPAAAYSAPTTSFVAAQAPRPSSLSPVSQLPLFPAQDPNQNLMGLLLALSGSRPAAAPAPPPPQPPQQQSEIASLLALLAQAMSPASPVAVLLKALSNPPVAAPAPALAAAPPPSAVGGMASDLLIQALAHALVQSNRPPPQPQPQPQAPDLQQQLILQLLSSLLPQSAAGTGAASGSGSGYGAAAAAANGASSEHAVRPSAPAPAAPESTVRPPAGPLAPSDVLPPTSPAPQQVSPLLQALLGNVCSGGAAAAALPLQPPSAVPVPKPMSPTPALPTDPAQLQLLLQLLASQQQQQPQELLPQQPPSSAGTGASVLDSPARSEPVPVPAERGPSPS